MATNQARPTWEQYKAKIEAAIKAVVDAQNALDAAQIALTQAQETLRDVADTPPGQVPDIGG